MIFLDFPYVGGIHHQLASVLPYRITSRLFELIPLANSDKFVVIERVAEIFKIPIMLNGDLMDEEPFCAWHIHGQ